MSDSPAPALLRAAQSLTPGDRVELYTINLATINISAEYNFTPSVRQVQGTVVFKGKTYTVTDVKCEGFEITTNGALPRPTITIGNANKIMSSATILHDDLIGAELTRIVTYKQFLSGESQSDPTASFIPEVYRFEQKLSHNKHEISWSLAAVIDQEGVMLPRRLIVPDVCLFKYRRPLAGGGFDYSGVECPYAGPKSYNVDGEEIANHMEDTPSRRLSTCCGARFGKRANYPFGGFPGVSRLRF